MIRAIVFSATVSALFCLWLDRTTPVQTTQVDYCVVTYRAAAQDPQGKWHYGWAKGYGPCSQQDEYRSI